MKITKVIKRTYTLEIMPRGVMQGMTYGSFAEARTHFSREHNRKFEKCFICEKKFQDEDVPEMVTVKGHGNRFCCQECYAKMEAEHGTVQR